MSIAPLLRWTSIIALSVFVLCGSPIPHARADQGALSEGEAPIPRECTGRFVAGPSVGIVLGLGTATVGAIGLGGAAYGAYHSDVENNSPGFIAGFATTFGVGLAAFIYSSIKLHKNLDVRFERCGGYKVAHRREPPRRRIVFDGASFRF